MVFRFSDLCSPSEPRARKLLGMALQLGALFCIAVDLADGRYHPVAGLIFIAWLFLGYQIQASAEDREQIDALRRQLALLERQDRHEGHRASSTTCRSPSRSSILGAVPPLPSGSSSVGRASASQAEGREFEPRLPLQ